MTALANVVYLPVSWHEERSIRPTLMARPWLLLANATEM